MNVIKQYDEHIMPSYGRYDLVAKSGVGRVAVDENDNEYIDFGSGIGTNSLGYCDSKWADAVCKQVWTLQHSSNYYYTKIQADFAQKLCKMTGYDKLFFGNSGAEANECAIKLARKYSFDKYGADANRHNIITLLNSFHGRTLTTLSATGQLDKHNYFFPFTQGFEHVAANDITAFEDMLEKLGDTVCAVMLEFIQGEGGVNALDKEYVKELFSICADKDILLIADEIQTGVGRTGTFLASAQYKVKPDITTLAKGLAGGLPIGVCLAGEKCADVLTAGTHGSTFGGNPVVCAGGLAVIERIDDYMLYDIKQKGEHIRAKLLEIPEVEGVDGVGLMVGVRLKTKNAQEVCAAALKNGLLLLTASEKVRLLPPLNITHDEIDRGIEILKEILA